MGEPYHRRTARENPKRRARPTQPAPRSADLPGVTDEPASDRTADTLEVVRLPTRAAVAIDIGAPGERFSVELTAGRAVVLGSGRDADVRVPDRTVSARHCSVRADAGGVEVVNLGSKNGLFVGAARLSSAWLVEDGATFVIGTTSVTTRSRARPDSVAPPSVPGLVGTSPAMRRVARQIALHAKTRASVLFQGESGTGKDVAARALHLLSGRKGRYVPLNVGAFPDALFDAELFGHRRGAYTGAVASRPGAFELAHGGTLFLDEVAELTAAAQVKLLRVVEDGCVRPLGASQPVQVDVRVAAASWASLAERASQQRFRLDLFHRLATVTIVLPPLRQRTGDIPALSRELLARLEPDVGPKRLTASAFARLAAHAWPGNVRELSAALYRAAVAAGEEIDACHLELPAPPMGLPGRPGPSDALELIARHGSVSGAARAAGIPRSTLRAWLSKERQNRPTTLIEPMPGANSGRTANLGTDDDAEADSCGAVVK